MKYLVYLLLILSMPSFAKERIIALGGDVTEIIYALDAGQDIIARDSTSLRPKQAEALPDIGYLRQLNAEGILALKPTMVIASSAASPSRVLQQISTAGVKVILVPTSQSLRGIEAKITTIAKALHYEAKAPGLIDALQKQTASIQTGLPVYRLLYIMANSGTQVLVAGRETAADAVIKLAGQKNAVQRMPHYQALSAEAMIAAKPDAIIIDGEALEALGGEQYIWHLSGVSQTPAGQARRLIRVDQLDLLTFSLSTPEAIRNLQSKLEEIYANAANS